MKQNRSANIHFMLACTGFLVVLAIRFFGEQVNAINSTMLAFSYEHGFISRGLIGTIYQLLDRLLPANMETYAAVMVFTKVVTGIFFAVLLLFCTQCLKRAADGQTQNVQYLILFYLMFAVPFFVAKYNFGRLDLYMLMLSLLGVILLMRGRGEGLLIPIAAVATMVHQGYVFMFFNIILVLLFCKICDESGKKRRNYIGIFTGAIVVASVLFLWFELFSHVNGEQAYDQVVSLAKALSRNGKSIHTDVIDKEISGMDLTSREIPFHLQNLVQFPIFLILVSPYLIIGFQFLRNMILEAGKGLSKWKYTAIAAGPLTILPNLLLKVDFGRWIFAIVSYYLIVFLALLAMGDAGVKAQFLEMNEKSKGKKGMAMLLFLYPFILQPFCDVSICHVTAYIAGILNDACLHWW